MKTCGKCKESLSLDSFHKRTASKDGKAAKCKKCDKIAFDLWRKENKEKWSASTTRAKKKYLSNPENLEKERAKYREYDSRPEVRARKKAYRSKPEVRERLRAKERAAFKKRYDANPRPYIVKSSMRHKRLKQITPKWLSPEQLEELKRFYEQCPKGFCVDHIVPVNGETVRGLHVPWNLQHLTVHDNAVKSNKILIDMSA
jgi:hypothetical protein